MAARIRPARRGAVAGRGQDGARLAAPREPLPLGPGAQDDRDRARAAAAADRAAVARQRDAAPRAGRIRSRASRRSGAARRAGRAAATWPARRTARRSPARGRGRSRRGMGGRRGAWTRLLSRARSLAPRICHGEGRAPAADTSPRPAMVRACPPAGPAARGDPRRRRARDGRSGRDRPCDRSPARGRGRRGRRGRRRRRRRPRDGPRGSRRPAERRASCAPT